jgi:hypothetical protein
MLADLERATEQSFGLASEEELASWSRSWIKSVPKVVITPPRGTAQRPGSAPTIGIDHLPLTIKIARGKSPAVVASVIGAALALLGSALFVHFARSSTAAPEPMAVVPAAAMRDDPTMIHPARAEQEKIGSVEPAPEPATSAEPVRSPSSRAAPPSRSTAPPLRAPSAAHDALARAAPLRAAQPGGDQRGVLDLGSEPGFAYITIDGVSAGATPLFGRELAAGSHRIEVSREGLGSKTLTIEVKPGERVSRVVKLP